MKFFLLLLVLLFGVWLWRSSRPGGKKTPNQPPAAPPATAQQPQDMVRCAVCDVHVPRADAISGPAGVYCCAEHRQRAEP